MKYISNEKFTEKIFHSNWFGVHAYSGMGKLDFVCVKNDANTENASSSE